MCFYAEVFGLGSGAEGIDRRFYDRREVNPADVEADFPSQQPREIEEIVYLPVLQFGVALDDFQSAVGGGFV